MSTAIAQSAEACFDPQIARVAAACEVPEWWVSIRYSKGSSEDESEGPWRWAVDVIVIRKAARVHDQSTISGYGATISDAASDAIETVRQQYASGEYGPASASKKRP